MTPPDREESYIQKDDIEIKFMHAKQHHIRGCYSLIGGPNCALSLRKTLLEQIPGVKIRVYRKRYIRVFVNPCKPQANKCQASLKKFDARTASIVGDIVVECAIVLSFYLSHTSARTHTHASARAHTYKRAIVRPAAAVAFGGGVGASGG